MFVGCSGDNPAPGNPDTGTDEPSEPDKDARDSINMYYSNWIAYRDDLEKGRKYEIEIIRDTEWSSSAMFNEDYNPAMGGYSEAYQEEFLQKLFGLTIEESEQIFQPHHIHYYVRYNDEYRVAKGNYDYDYYPYYIEFEFLLDIHTPSTKVNSSTYNRIVYSANVDDRNNPEEGKYYGIRLIPTGSDEQNEIFTDELVSQILYSWYESYFKGLCAQPGVGMVELVRGTNIAPDEIRFTLDPDIPVLSQPGGLADQTPSWLISLGTLERK